MLHYIRSGHNHWTLVNRTHYCNHHIWNRENGRSKNQIDRLARTSWKVKHQPYATIPVEKPKLKLDFIVIVDVAYCRERIQFWCSFWAEAMFIRQKLRNKKVKVTFILDLAKSADGFTTKLEESWLLYENNTDRSSVVEVVTYELIPASLKPTTCFLFFCIDYCWTVSVYFAIINRTFWVSGKIFRK